LLRLIYSHKTMKRYYLILLIFICITSYSQSNFTVPKDASIKAKMDEYFRLMKKADVYEARSENELITIDSLKNFAHNYIDSAKVYSLKAKDDRSKAAIYLQKLNLFLGCSNSYLIKADSAIAIGNIYKDSAIIKDKEAEAYCLTISQEEKEALNQQAFNYVVQIGAGNKMKADYFDKVADVKVVKANDGVKRYVVGLFNTRDEAKACKQKMIILGYPDAFIRTIESLYK